MFLSPRSAVKLFSGRANLPLSEEIAKVLNIKLGGIKISPFSDGEIYLKILESVRKDDIFIIQPTSPPVNENLMELLIMIDALKRASAGSITVLIPYFGYSRQDRKASGREPITSKLIADLLKTAGADRIVCIDLHANQIMGFFDTLVDHLSAIPVLAEYIKKLDLKDLVVVSPDVGGVARARTFSKILGDAPLAIIDKRRSPNQQNYVEVLNIIGEIENKTCVLVDDLIDTAGTISKAAALLKEKGAVEIYACASHGVLSGNGLKNIQESCLKELIITDTIILSEEKKINKIKQLTIAPLLAEVIKRIHSGESVSSMFIQGN